MAKRSKCCLVGIADDHGVLNVGGRLGASQGPAAFRKAWMRLSGERGVVKAVQDLGNTPGAGTENSHRQTADFVRKAQAEWGLSMIVGGGHDHGYSQLLGVKEALGKKARIACINIDAHFDLRKPSPQIGSGSPYYLAIESGVLDPKRFTEFGIQAHCNSPELWEYARQKRIRTLLWADLRNGKAITSFNKELKKLAAISDAVVVSFDLDAAASAFAPGVSAPQAEGFSASEMIEMAEIAGLEKKVVSLGIFELNPFHDIQEMTSRLAATCAFHFADAALEG